MEHVNTVMVFDGYILMADGEVTMTDNFDEFTESPADEARRKRYACLIELLDEWMNADDSEAEEWEQLRAAIEEHRLSYRRRFNND